MTLQIFLFLKVLKYCLHSAKALSFKLMKLTRQIVLDMKAMVIKLTLSFSKIANKMLIEHSSTRQDGTWFFSNNQYAGSIGIKLYSDFLKESTHIENETFTNFQSSFLKKDGTLNPSLQKIRKNFEPSCIPSDLKNILRIHLEFPGVKGFKPETSVKRDLKYPGVEDVIVYIDCSNMDEFFYENIHENQKVVHILKNIIRYMTAKSGEVTCNCQILKCEDTHCSCFKKNKKCDSLCEYCKQESCNNLI
ncbi:15448_t:CDS:1 [Funneliformis geosporum]|uniref:16399_t:CDS:1 n=1 Tax=Funneliformis geosporum TaxID=1117311 RepID=A0A9W4SP95_9GLOM|nr:16399_t:CDS:1 [Funneliformis geosporum]CAI2181701.1 15448_t:CDS:1 [Funneliformis geosporum]